MATPSHKSSHFPPSPLPSYPPSHPISPHPAPFSFPPSSKSSHPRSSSESLPPSSSSPPPFSIPSLLSSPSSGSMLTLDIERKIEILEVKLGETKESPKPNVLVLGPGGVKGFVELGALFKLEQEHYLSEVKEFCGVSIGALICLLMVSGFNIKDITTHALKMKLFQDSSFSIKEISIKKGLFSTDPIKKNIGDLLKNKHGFIPTLEQLFIKTGLILVVVATNLDVNSGTVEYLSYRTNPKLSCLDAVMLSINIPFLFHQIKYEDCVYVDGAIGGPYPVDVYDTGKNRVLGLYIENFYSSSEKVEYDVNLYINRIVNTLLRTIRQGIIKNSSPRCKHLCLTTDVISTIGLELNIDHKAKMLIDGIYAADKFLKNVTNYPP